MKVKQYIVTYNNEREINNCLKTIFSSLSEDELLKLEINIINNHSNFKLHDEYIGKVNVLNNILRPDFSTGHLSRNWNQAIINGFKDLNNPDCDIVITNQDDIEFKPNYLNRLIEIHKTYDLVQCKTGDSVISYTPNAIKRIGLWDERFCNIGYQEGDYFIRAALYHKDKVTLNEIGHERRCNFISDMSDIININYLGGLGRNETYHLESMKYHSHSSKIFYAKWGNVKFDKWDANEISSELKPLIPSFIYYPYFELVIETLKEQNFIY
jgi:hypothetical protein